MTGVEALMIISGVAATGEAVSQVSAAERQQHSLDLQAKQQELKYQQETLSQYDQAKKIIEHQVAQAGAKGVSLASPSFNAVQRDTMNIASKTLKNEDIENNLAQLSIQNEKQSVQDSLFGKLFGDVAQAGASFATLSSKTPTVG